LYEEISFMETSREKVASTIRLRYNRQFQSGGHAHTVDAECLLPVGASQETREQIVRELELSVEQLVHQITHQGTRPAETMRSQTATSGRSAQAAVHVPVSPEASQPMRGPVSDSMPTTPATSGERKIRLPDFINAIKKYWDMSPQEAMKLLRVQTLDGLNYREAYTMLKALVERRNAGTQSSSTPYNATRPVPTPPEAPRSTNRGTPPAPDSYTPTNMLMTARQQQQSASHAAAITAEVPPLEQENQPRPEPEPGEDFAGSSKASIPITFGVVRDLAPRTYNSKFDEEDDDEDYDVPEEQAVNHLSSKLKLDELKELRGNTLASAGRLKVLDNVIGSQVDEQQLQKIMQAAWGIATPKKLKADQVEGLITWAKEDFFEEEVKSMLTWLADEEA
ncbi:MAG: hypothetical protein ACRDHZ_25420, partial [Ktedonobacteraceae bacterium]